VAAKSHKRHKTRNPGIIYRLRVDGSRTYYVYASGQQLKVEGGEKEAVVLQAELRQRSARGERIAPRNVKLAALAEEWFASKQGLRDSTLSDYRAALDKVLLPRFGHLKVGRVSTDEIAALISELRRDGLSGPRIKNILKPLNGTMKLALRRGLIPQNPFDLLTRDEQPKMNLRERHDWSPEHITDLLAAAAAIATRPDAKYDYTLLLRVGIFTGPRLGELLGLRWCDIDLKNNVINIRHQASRHGRLMEPKTPKAIRRIPLAHDMTAALTQHKLASGFSTETDFVFSSKKGTPLNPSNVRNRGLKPALEAAGLDSVHPKITFHDLRHAFASIMIERGVSSVVLADLMGHRDSRTTERIYIHLFNRERTDEQVRAAMQSAMRL
jgi:integrase